MSRKPNIIFVYADDLGRGMLSCYGQPHFETPNIDRLANEGVRFTNAYGCFFCAPARASVISGIHDCHRGRWTYTSGNLYYRLNSGASTYEELSELINSTSLNAGPEEVFLGDVAKKAGYVTAEIGKLEWGFATTAENIKSHGWDYHYGYYDHAQCHGFYPPYLFDNGKKVDIPGNTRDDFGKTGGVESEECKRDRWDFTGKAVYSQDLFDQKILEFIRENKDRPFFLFHPSQLPHGPIMIPEIHPSVKNNTHLTDYEKEYASMVIRLDETVGLILNELEKLGIDDNTMVVFSSDNGHCPYYREEGRCEPKHNMQTGETYDNVTTKFYSELSGDVFNGNDGMAGLKFTGWEGGARIPYVVRWPEKVQQGVVSDHLFANYDLMPTIAEALGTGMPDDKDGISFLPVLMGETDRQQKHDHIVYASHQGPNLVTDDGWKLRFIKHERQNLYQLYYLPDDYREEKNLVKDAADVTRRLSADLLRSCDGNFLNGTSEAHHIWMPGIEFYGPECDWRVTGIPSGIQ
ncbi:MAG: sulfatase-like hydrolase/transferase [bacterium]